MRVLMATSSYYPIIGGAETVIRNLSIGLNKIGIDTDVMTFNMNRKWSPKWQGKCERYDGVDIIRIPALNWFPMEHSDRLTFGINLLPGRFRNRLKNYDIIHFHGEDLTFPFFSYMVARPKIFHSHGFSLDFYKRYFLSRFTLKNAADLFISISRGMTKDYIQLGISPNKIRYLPNGVDTRLFRPGPERENNLILFVGRISYDKGLHVLLDSLKNVKRRVHLVIIGPPGGNAAYLSGIQQQIIDENKKGIHKITYLGAQEKATVAKWCRKASIFVSSSFREAFGLAIIEAMSCGSAVIATSVGGIVDVVDNGKSGVLIPPNDKVKLAEAIQNLLDDDATRSMLGRTGRRSVLWRYSQEVVLRRLVEIYKEITSQRLGLTR